MTRPFYVVAASVPPGNRLRGFHGDAGDDIQALMLRPPTFRRGGFDVYTGVAPRRTEDGSLESGGDRKLLRVYQDGAVLLRVAADSDFLGWGIEERQFARWPRLNPVPVVEIHASFVHFYREILRRLKAAPDFVSVKLQISAGDFGAGKLFLTPYYPPGHFDPAAMDRYFLQEDPGTEALRLDPSEVEGQPDRAAFRILAAFASLFDMPENVLPFTRVEGQEQEIDVERIKALHG